MDRALKSLEEKGNETEELLETTIELEDVAVGSTETAGKTRVGKILTRKILNRAVQTICGAAWGESLEVKISDMGPNMYLFSFPSAEIAQVIMQKSPWAVMNNILSLQFWNPEVAVSEIDFSKIPIWVQIHGLPMATMTVTNAGKIMKLVGNVLEVEDLMVDGVLLRSFMRVRVDFNTLRPLPTGCWIPRKNLPKS